MGNKFEQQQDAEYARLARRGTLVLAKLATYMEGEMADGTIIREIRVQGPNMTGGGFRAIIKADVNGGRIVAFHNAETPEELVAGITARLGQDALKWREDLPYTPGRSFSSPDK